MRISVWSSDVCSSYLAAVQTHLTWLIYQPVVALELSGNSLLQFRRAVDCRIFGLPRADRGNGGVLDEIRRIDVGLTRRKTTTVNACAFTPVHPAGHGKGGAGLEDRTGVGWGKRVSGRGTHGGRRT